MKASSKDGRRRAACTLALAALACLGVFAGPASAKGVKTSVDDLPAGGVTGTPLKAERVSAPDAPASGEFGIKAHGNDTQGTAFAIPMNTRYFTSTASAVTEAPAYSCGSSNSVNTVWYRFTGTGGRVVVTTLGSNFDTVLVVGTAADLSGSPACSDDINAGQGVFTSGLAINTTAGAVYYAQVGGAAADPSDTVTGSVSFSVLGNDDRAQAASVPFGADTLTNIGSGTESGEQVSCGAAGYDATVWLRFTVPAKGTVKLAASSTEFAPTVAIYPLNGPTRIGDCAAGSSSGPLSASVSVDVPAGEYVAQIGSVDGFYGTYNYDLQFTQDNDVDDDGSLVGQDCNDNNPAIRPGVPDPTNGVDDNCDGTVDPDIDGDGVARAPVGNDCDDNNAAIKPGGVEVPGNRVDENCDGTKDPFPEIQSSVRVSWAGGGGGYSLTELLVRRVPAGGKIRLSCTRRCGIRTRTLTNRGRRSRSVNLLKYVRGRRLRTGVVVEVRVTLKNRIGHVTRIQIRSSKPRKTELCLTPGARKPKRCS